MMDPKIQEIKPIDWVQKITTYLHYKHNLLDILSSDWKVEETVEKINPETIIQFFVKSEASIEKEKC